METAAGAHQLIVEVRGAAQGEVPILNTGTRRQERAGGDH
jgi:hypothetical protein